MGSVSTLIYTSDLILCSTITQVRPPQFELVPRALTLLKSKCSLTCHAAKRCVMAQIVIAETGKEHELIFCITDKMFLLLFDYWWIVRFYLLRFAGMQCLRNGSQAPKMVQFVFGYDIVVLIWSYLHDVVLIWLGTGMAQWWERSPPTNVSRVRFPDQASYVGWVCCWFSSLLREVFLRVLRFSPLLKSQHFQIPVQSGIVKHFIMSLWLGWFAQVLPVFDIKFAFTFFYICNSSHYTISTIRF